MTDPQPIQPGDHVGVTFDDDDSLAATMLDFAERGRRAGARVLVLAAPRLARVLPGVQLTEPRGTLDGLRDFYAQAVRQAVAEGLSGLWTSVEMSWARGIDPEELVAAECGLNTLFSDGRLTALCHYDSRLFPSAQLARFHQAHPVGQQGACLRYRHTGRGVTFTGEADHTNLLAWQALTRALPGGEAVIDISGMSFLDVRSMAQLGLVAAARCEPLSILASPGQSAHLRMLGVDRVATLVTVEEPGLQVAAQAAP
ncbi:MEDS domain-containing protein [Nonomuraea dietziae]|uniref:MEDS domain-containing protein n=1 Tax=Nonomuraea dietziae TaxID=65515 RepID=UPI0034429C8F